MAVLVNGKWEVNVQFYKLYFRQYFNRPHDVATRALIDVYRVVNIRRHVSTTEQAAEPSDTFSLIRSLYFYSLKGHVISFTLTESRTDSVTCSESQATLFYTNPEFQMGEVRKLQKKLRQIENLEIKISLTPEERFKVQKHIICCLPAYNV